jgi:hypothetical protein
MSAGRDDDTDCQLRDCGALVNANPITAGHGLRQCLWQEAICYELEERRGAVGWGIGERTRLNRFCRRGSDEGGRAAYSSW